MIKHLIILVLFTSGLFANQFERNNKLNIVFDKKNSLIWQDFKEKKLMSINEANKYCQNLQIDNYKEWRLPTIEELESIINYKNSSIYKEFKFVYFPYITNDKYFGSYWSKDKFLMNKRYLSLENLNSISFYSVNFSDGTTDFSKNKNYVRCVKSNNTVPKKNIQKYTKKIMWQDSEEMLENRIDWNNAKKYCIELTENGFNDWILPTLNNLKLLRDKNKTRPTIKDNFKFVTYYHGYWTNTNYYKDNNFAYTVHFNHNGIHVQKKTAKKNVRCMRNVRND